jgi:lipoyl(octanoyl) transferase
MIKLAAGAHAKIASIGVKVDARGVSRHGFALNIVPQMRYWEGIVPCGLDGVLAQLIVDAPGVSEAAKKISVHFGEVFNMAMQWKEAPELNLLGKQPCTSC